MDSDQPFIDPEDLYLGDDLDVPNSPEGDSWLPSEDYNLNSPLMRDKVDLLVQEIHSKLTCPERTAPSPHIYLINLKGSASYHRFAVQNFLQAQTPPLNDAYQILKDVEKGITSASDIHEAFWKHFGKGLSVNTLDPRWFSDYYDQDFRFRKDFEAYWFLHRVIVLMNLTSSGPTYMAQSGLFSGVKIVKTDNKRTVIVEHGVYGRVAIREGICIMEKWHQVLDRNMVLALKDTLIGRCAVKLVTYKRADGHVQNSRQKWKDWFSLGGNLLLRSSNESYRGFKLIEPLCLNQLHLIARKERPFIPPYTKFLDHLDQKVKDLLEDNGVDLRHERLHLKAHKSV